jgi:hypothetical protein
VEDRQVRSAEVKALGEQRRQLRARQGRLLLLQARSEHEAALRQTRIEELQQAPIADQIKKELGRLRQAQIRRQSGSPPRQQQIEALSRELAELELRGRDGAKERVTPGTPDPRADGAAGSGTLRCRRPPLRR